MDGMITRLAAVVSHPEFSKMLQEIEAKPGEERMKFAKIIATPKELARRGIPMPEGFRITTRIFEAPGASVVRAVKIDEDILGADGKTAYATTICASLGFILCVTVGHTTQESPEEHAIVSGPD